MLSSINDLEGECIGFSHALKPFKGRKQTYEKAGILHADRSKDSDRWVGLQQSILCYPERFGSSAPEAGALRQK